MPHLAPATRQIKASLVPLIVARRLSGHSVDLPSSRSIDKLPPLQKIQSKGIRRRVFTHNSVTSGHNLGFQPPEGHPNADNEECAVIVLVRFDFSAKASIRLAYIGDQVVSLALTDLIQHLYPHLRVGPATVR